MPAPTDTPLPALPASAWQTVRNAQRKAQRSRQRAARPRAGDGRASEAAQTPASPVTAAQRRGQATEDAALALLCRAGLAPLARNLRCKAGEIDLVMRDGDVLVFVEVRYRAAARHGGAAASVDAAKQARVARAAAHFLPRLARAGWNGRQPACRYDVVAAEDGSLTWLRGAFDTPEAPA
ncbi:Predicted endonuclease distantly related to archaeal Holliday junction resolvase [plant metagenome]